MDSVKKEKHRFNFVDAIIIIAVIAALALVGYIFLFRNDSKGEKVRICYAVECAEIREDITQNFKPGELYTMSGYELGHSVDCVVGDREYLGTTGDGRTVKSDIPGYKSVIFILETDALKMDYEYKLDDYVKFQVGCYMRLTSRSIAGEGYCVGLTEIKTDEDKQAFVNKVKTMAYKADVPGTEVEENE